MKRLSVIIIAMAGLLTLFVGTALAADVAVIVNKGNKNVLDKGTLGKIFLGRMSSWPAGGVIVAVNLPADNSATAAFNAGVLGKSVQAIREIWAQNVFTGKAIPPKVIASDDEVKRLVAGNKNAIGYINAASLDNSVKAVMTLR